MEGVMSNHSSNVVKKLAKNLRTLRLVKRMTQEDLAKLTGVSQQAVGKWEQGLSSPDYDNLVRLSIFYNVSTDYLLGLK
jgi:transcriptional regulator with XRE-family HTH domain